MRKQFNDKFQVASVDRAKAASAALNGVTNGAEFEVGKCYSPTILVHVQSLAANKKIAVKLQEKETSSSSWVDVAKGVKTDASQDDDITANGNYAFFYAGSGYSVRAVIVSKDASPAAVVDLTHVRHNLWENPNNISS